MDVVITPHDCDNERRDEDLHGCSRDALYDDDEDERRLKESHKQDKRLERIMIVPYEFIRLRF